MNRIRELRIMQGLTMSELGKRVGCSEASISYYELGKREAKYETLLKLAEALDTSVDYLLGNNEESFISYTEKEIKILNAIKSLSPEAQDDMTKIITLLQNMNDDQRSMWVKMVSALLK